MKAPFVGFLGFCEHSGFRRFPSGIVSDNNEEVAPFHTRKYEKAAENSRLAVAAALTCGGVRPNGEPGSLIGNELIANDVIRQRESG
jgi:hypothetical protein